MRTYKHNNEELLSGESERILHKNAKNYRIRKQEQLEKEKKREIAFVIGMVIVAVITLCVFNTVVTKTNTRTTEELVKVAKCVDYNEC